MKTAGHSQLSTFNSPFKQTAVRGNSGGVVHGEMERISQALTQRVKALMPQMVSHVAELQAQVKAHLVMIGFAI